MIAAERLKAGAPAEADRSIATMAIGGIAVADLSGEQAIATIEACLQRDVVLRVAFLNAHCVNLARARPDYRDTLSRFLVLCDGVGVDIGARLLHGRSFTENLNGTDFVPRLLARLRHERTVALIGGAPGIAERAAIELCARCPQHRFVAVSDGFFDGEAGRSRVLSTLEALNADIVLVALGVPLQEEFIDHHLDGRHGRIFLGVGALFDFLSGRIGRAPRLVRRLRLEWAFRLGREPQRLWRRYVLGNPRFLFGIAMDKLRTAREPKSSA